jgi:hypothetical protein
MDILNTVIATVVSVKGVVEVRTANGLTKTVSAGDQLQANDTLITGAGAEVEIELINGEKLVINEPTEVFLDESTYGATEYTGNEVEPDVLEQIQEALGEEVTDLADLEATAAGPAAGGPGGNAAGNFPVYGRHGAEGFTDSQGTPFGIGPHDIPEGEGAEEEGEGLLAEAPEPEGLIPEEPAGEEPTAFEPPGGEQPGGGGEQPGGGGEEPGGGGEEPGGGGEEPADLPHGISNVLMLFQGQGEDVIAVKIDDYGGDVKDPADPAQYIDELAETVDGEFIAYYIKAATDFYDADGNVVTDQVDELGLSEYLNPHGNTFGGSNIDYSYAQGELEGGGDLDVMASTAQGEEDSSATSYHEYADFRLGEDSLDLHDLLDTDQNDAAQLLDNYIDMSVQGNKVTLSIDSNGIGEGGIFEPDHVVEVSITGGGFQGLDEATLLDHLLNADYDDVSGF